MICPKCKRENEDGSMFCRYCGSSLNPVPEKDSSTSSILIFVWVVVFVLLSIVNNLYTRLIDNWYEGTQRMVYLGIVLLQNLSFILPPLAIKNKTLKIIGLIIMSAYVVWLLYQNISWGLSEI